MTSLTIFSYLTVFTYKGKEMFLRTYLVPPKKTFKIT